MRTSAYTVEQMSSLFRCLGDSTRLRIVQLLLLGGEQCVCDIERSLAISQSKTSRHLSHLKHAGLVSDRRDGTWVYYRLARELPGAVRTLLRESKKALTACPQIQADAQRTQTGTPHCQPITELGRRRA